MRWWRSSGESTLCFYLRWTVRCTNNVGCGFSILCGDYAIKQIDEPFVSEADDHDEWAI